jgi:8-oxo-dGTP pyrophosphatase MutT (NUDIX family)
VSRTLPKRPTARLFVFDPSNRLLLIRYRTTPPVAAPHAHVRSIWFTPGGGLEPGETAREAAARELQEETRLLAPVGPEVAYREQDVTFFIKKVCVVERYFVVRSETPVIDTSYLVVSEGDEVLEVGWWSMTELRQLTDHIEPPTLIALAERLARGDIPDEPVNLGPDE